MPINRRPIIRRLGLAGLTLAAPVVGLAAPVPASAGEARIVRGHEVEPGRYPFMVSLEVSRSGATGPDRHFCGGTLVDREWVLTAAHCIARTGPSQFVAVIGRSRLSDHDSGTVRTIRQVVVHPDYDGDVTSGADAALLRLAAPVDGITPLELVRPDERARWEPGDAATVAGWGVTAEDDPRAPDDLRAAGAVIQPDSVMGAPDFYGADFKASDMVGAGPRRGGFGPCFGDSGGPLLIGRGRGVRQVGIVSWGERCASGPAVYTRVGEGRVRAFLDCTIPRRRATPGPSPAGGEMSESFPYREECPVGPAN